VLPSRPRRRAECLRERSARLNFHPGVVPRLQRLDEPLADRQVAVEVRRMSPLSLKLERMGAEPLADTLVAALSVLARQEEAEAQGV